MISLELHILASDEKVLSMKVLVSSKQTTLIFWSSPSKVVCNIESQNGTLQKLAQEVPELPQKFRDLQKSCMWCMQKTGFVKFFFISLLVETQPQDHLRGNTFVSRVILVRNRM